MRQTKQKFWTGTPYPNESSGCNNKYVRDPQKEKINRQIQSLAKDLSAMNESQAFVLITNILSESQYQHFGQRYEIAKLLRLGYSQRHISNIVETSIATVTRVSVAMKNKNI